MEKWRKDKIKGEIFKKRGEVGWGRHSIGWRNSPTSYIFHFFLWAAVKPSLPKHWQSEWATHMIVIRCLNQMTLRMKDHRLYFKLFPDISTPLAFPDDEPRYPATLLLSVAFFWSLIHYPMLMTTDKSWNVSSDKFRSLPPGSSPFSTPFNSVQTDWQQTLHQSASQSHASSYSYSLIIGAILPFSGEVS